MVIPKDLFCPSCKGKDLFFKGIQKGYGHVPDKVLLTCRECFTTFSMDVVDTEDNDESGSGDEA
ncbi:MAG TPA: hypothetical protein ACFYD3_06420 [Candidatus Hypogeohydataceae bacterium YC41]